MSEATLGGCLRVNDLGDSARSWASLAALFRDTGQIIPFVGILL